MTFPFLFTQPGNLNLKKIINYFAKILNIWHGTDVNMDEERQSIIEIKSNVSWQNQTELSGQSALVRNIHSKTPILSVTY